MIRMVRVTQGIEESTVEESPEHEWAEYNLPSALLLRLSVDGEDNLAFFGLATEQDNEPPGGSP